MFADSLLDAYEYNFPRIKFSIIIVVQFSGWNVRIDGIVYEYILGSNNFQFLYFVGKLGDVSVDSHRVFTNWTSIILIFRDYLFRLGSTDFLYREFSDVLPSILVTLGHKGNCSFSPPRVS